MSKKPTENSNPPTITGSKTSQKYPIASKPIKHITQSQSKPHITLPNLSKIPKSTRNKTHASSQSTKKYYKSRNSHRIRPKYLSHSYKQFPKRSNSQQKSLASILGRQSPKQEEMNLLFLKRRINNHLVTAESKDFNATEKHVVYKCYNSKKVDRINPYMKEDDSGGSNLLNMTTDQKIFSRLTHKVKEIHELVSFKIPHFSIFPQMFTLVVSIAYFPQ